MSTKARSLMRAATVDEIDGEAAAADLGVVSSADQTKIGGLPLHTKREVASYLKPGEGFERVAPVVLKLLASYPDIAKALKIDIGQMNARLGDAVWLGEKANALALLARRADENRLGIESDVYRAILKVNRFAQNADDADLQRVFGELASWVAATHGGGRDGAEPAGVNGATSGTTPTPTTSPPATAVAATAGR